jgi:hypothetical protein
MDATNKQGATHWDRFRGDPEALLAELQSGLDALRSLISQIVARERTLELDTLRSIQSQLDNHEQHGKSQLDNHEQHDIDAA